MVVGGLAVDIADVCCLLLVCSAWCVNVCVVLGLLVWLFVIGVIILVVAGFGCRHGFGFSCFGFRFGVVVNVWLCSLFSCEFDAM